MSIEAPDSVPSSRVLEAMRTLNAHGRGLCPPATDAEQWAAHALEDLAEAVVLIEGVVHRLSGRQNAAVTRSARLLATTITGHRNVALTAGRHHPRAADPTPVREPGTAPA